MAAVIYEDDDGQQKRMPVGQVEMLVRCAVHLLGSLAGVARAVHTSRVAVGKWLRGSTAPSTENLRRLNQVVGFFGRPGR